MISTMSFLGLVFAVIVTTLLIIFINKIKVSKQLKISFNCLLTCLLICCTGLILQLLLADSFGIPAIIFDYFVYIGTCFLPVSFLFTSIIFSQTKITFNKYYCLLFIIPIISLIVLWTNNYHHLFYITYSTNYLDTIYGPYFYYVHTLYSYLLIGISFINFIRYTIKNSGFFSKQSIFIIIGALIPVAINILGTFNVIEMSIYITPISFTFAVFFFALAIFKFDFLKVAPIALQRIVDRMSDAYIIVNEDNTITDFNQTFLDLFAITESDLRNIELNELLEKHSNMSSMKSNILLDSIQKAKNSLETISFDEEFTSINKHFHIEISSITNKETFLGILILLKDITQHMIDMQTIKENQDMLVEQERLVSLGQMIGGISHNLKTPIMSIAGASQGLANLINEYDASIGDSEVTVADHHAIANDMREWISKINSYTNYMSDIISAVKGQAATLSESEEDTFTIDELIKRIKILMKNELQNNHIKMETYLNNLENTKIKGNVNSLVQVVNNLITNSIQSYRGDSGTINLKTENVEDKLIISVEDKGCGIPEDIQNKLFKEMVTTKGKNGTGLGMFMSYSTIKGKFDGDITFSSKEGEGSIFNIILPIE